MNRSPLFLLPATLLALGATSLLSGCGGDQAADSNAAQHNAAPPAAMSPSVSHPGATVFIITPTDGTAVAAPVSVKFGVSGIAVAPAGTYDANTGHHHLIIDGALASLDQPIPNDAQHLHFGKGQTEASVALEPGQHTLQLVLGDGNHMPHRPPVVSQVVTITVE